MWQCQYYSVLACKLRNLKIPNYFVVVIFFLLFDRV